MSKYVNICVWLSLSKYVHIYVWLSVSKYVNICVCLWVSKYAHIYDVWLPVFVCVRLWQTVRSYSQLFHPRRPLWNQLLWRGEPSRQSLEVDLTTISASMAPRISLRTRSTRCQMVVVLRIMLAVVFIFNRCCQLSCQIIYTSVISWLDRSWLQLTYKALTSDELTGSWPQLIWQGHHLVDITMSWSQLFAHGRLQLTSQDHDPSWPVDFMTNSGRSDAWW